MDDDSDQTFKEYGVLIRKQAAEIKSLRSSNDRLTAVIAGCKNCSDVLAPKKIEEDISSIEEEEKSR